MSRLSELPDNIQSWLRGVLALARGGVAGEKTAARERLDALLEKYDLTEADLLEDELIEVEISYEHEAERLLIILITAKVARKIDGLTNPRMKVAMFNATRIQAIEIQSMYDIYKARLWEDFNIFQTAFFGKNELLLDPELLPDDIEKPEPDMKKARAAWRMEQGLDQHSVRKGIDRD